MRPSRTTVKEWFVATLVPEDTLAFYISALRTDPNWHITDIGGTSVRTLRLVYSPTGALVDVVLRRTLDGWRPRLSYPSSRYAL